MRRHAAGGNLLYARIRSIGVAKDGSVVPVVFSASPVKDDGKITGVIVSFRDDTEQRTAREALLHAKRELETSQEQLVLALDRERRTIVP